MAAINPNDLDAIDENLPFTNSTLSNLLGRKLTSNEFMHYFERNPHGVLYVHEFTRFMNEDTFARNIIPLQLQAQRERQAGYVNGERPNIPIQPIGHLIGGGSRSSGSLPTPPAAPAYGNSVPSYGPPPTQYGAAPPAYGAAPPQYGFPPGQQQYGTPATIVSQPVYGNQPPPSYSPSVPPLDSSAPPPYSDAPPPYK